jgi:hypothetical protein
MSKALGLRNINTLYLSVLDEEGDEIGRVFKDSKTGTWAEEALTIEPNQTPFRYDTPHGALGMLLARITGRS